MDAVTRRCLTSRASLNHRSGTDPKIPSQVRTQCNRAAALQVTDVALPERQIVHEIDGITTVGGVRRHDVRLAMLLQPTHPFFRPSKFGTDRSPVALHVKEGPAGACQPKRPFR